MSELRKFCSPAHDRAALRAAEMIEDEFCKAHPGGRCQRLAAVQNIILDLLDGNMSAFVGAVAERAADAERDFEDTKAVRP